MKKRILVVDDEPSFTHLLKHTLEAEGYYDVEEENVATQATATARSFDPDLVVLDIMMPDLDGTEVAAHMKTDHVLRDVPVIFLTALVDDEDAPQGSCSSGGQTFLPKNVQVPRLIECIEEKLGRASAGATPVAAGARR
jgi:CheY-like chemotaxis protein